MARKRIIKYTLNSSSSKLRHAAIKNKEEVKEVFVNNFNKFNPRIIIV